MWDREAIRRDAGTDRGSSERAGVAGLAGSDGE